MMISGIGTGSLTLILVWATSTIVSTLWKQRLAPWMTGVGIAIFLYLIASVMLQISFPYQTWNISIYVVFFMATIMTLSGGTGIVVKLIREKRKVNQSIQVDARTSRH